MKLTPRLRGAIFISGTGSNMQSIISTAKGDPLFPLKPTLVVCNVPDAQGIERAQDQGIAVAVIDHKQYNTKAEFEADVNKVLEIYQIEFICLAGFMRVLSPEFVEKWSGKIINIHPSLLPSYPGLDTHKRALEGHAKIHGCTVHYVDAGVDTGEIIMQAAVAVDESDTEQTLRQRVLAQEHVIYPAAIRKILSRLESNSTNADQVLIVPTITE